MIEKQWIARSVHDDDASHKNLQFVSKSPSGNLTVSSSFALSSNIESMNLKALDHNYAGAGFRTSPAPDALPKPPVHWMNDSCSPTINHVLNSAYLDSIAIHLKGLLNVQA